MEPRVRLAGLAGWIDWLGCNTSSVNHVSSFTSLNSRSRLCTVHTINLRSTHHVFSKWRHIYEWVRCAEGGRIHA